MDDKAREPLPIWFFVGLALSVFGLLVVASALFEAPRASVLASLRPGLWWGGGMVVVGGVFVLVGLKGSKP